MARIRTIKPEFWVDDVMVELPPLTRLLFIGIWNFVDDDGYIEAKAKRIKMQVFPADDFAPESSLKALVDAGRLIECSSDQGPLLKVANWARHQRISHPTPTKFTNIREIPRDSAPASVNTPERSGEVSEPSALKGKEGKGKEGKGSLSFSSEVPNEQPPTVEANEISFYRSIVEGMGVNPADAQEAVETTLGIVPTDSDLARLCSEILAAAPKNVDNPTGYVLGAIRKTSEQGKWRKVLAGEQVKR